VPLALEQATTRALAPTPADRFPSAAAFAGALMPGPASPAAGEPWAGARRYAYLAAAALVLVALVLGYVGSRRHPAAPIKSMADARAAAGPGSLGATKSLAVLPLVNIGGDTATEYFSDGLTDELTSALGKVPGLRVAARSSAFAFKGRTVDVQEVGAKLHVANVLEGSVRRAGPRLRLTAQLLNAADGLTLWTETYERELKGVFQVQQDVAGAIAGALGTTLGVEARARVAARPPANLEAYDLYLKGRYAFNQETEEGFRTSIGLYQQGTRQRFDVRPGMGGPRLLLELVGGQLSRAAGGVSSGEDRGVEGRRAGLDLGRCARGTRAHAAGIRLGPAGRGA
jgi:TolB-like protein